MAKQMKKFLVGYLAKWSSTGVLEVEAENADDAEKKAEALRADAEGRLADAAALIVERVVR